nr:MAG TPA: hypothetical protein [Caudoviricetes sp.]
MAYYYLFNSHVYIIIYNCGYVNTKIYICRNFRCFS